MPYRTDSRNPRQDDVLAACVARAEPSKLAILDLDGCLFDTRPRQLQILRAYAERYDQPSLHAITSAHFTDRDLARTLAAAGCDPGLAPAITPFWWANFFDPELLAADAPLPGARRFVAALHDRGARIAYLTGRHTTMADATRRALTRFGFPLDARAELVHKEDAAEADEAFKARALDRLDTWGEVVVAFDNEPVNVNLFADRWPGATSVWVDTDHSSTDPLRPQVRTVQGFLLTTDRLPG